MLVPVSSGTGTANFSMISGRPAGIGLATFGLGKGAIHEQFHRVNPQGVALGVAHAARAKTVLAAIEAWDPIAYDLMVRLAEELALEGDGRAAEGAAHKTVG